MLFIAPGDVVAAPRSRRSQHRSAHAEFIATAQRGELRQAPPPAPAVCFEDSHVGRWLFAVAVIACLLVATQQLGWLS